MAAKKTVSQDASTFFQSVCEDDILKAEKYELATKDVAVLRENFRKIVSDTVDDLLYVGNSSIVNHTITKLVNDQNVKNQIGPVLLSQLRDEIMNRLKRHNRK